MEVRVTRETAKKLNDLATTSGRAPEDIVEDALAGHLEEPMASTSSLHNDSFRLTLDLFQTGVDVMRQNLRRRHPETRDEEIERLLGEWLHERPGAEAGDCQGRPVDVNARLA